MTLRTACLAAALVMVLTPTADAQGRRPTRAERMAAAKARAEAKEKAAKATQQKLYDAADLKIDKAVEFLVSVQEGEPKAEWPYEGVYRVRGIIPIGYRVGGTALTGLAVLQSPGYAESAERKAAIERATAFITGSIEHPLMKSKDFRARYDVRGWGYTCGLSYLLRLEKLERVPAGQADAVKGAIKWFVGAIQDTEIVEVGGWNYSRPRGFDAPANPAPFMTAPTLLALFDAKAQGYAVDEAVVNRGIKTLQVGRKSTNGAFSYGNDPRMVSPVPGAVGRMLCSEITLFLAGKGAPFLVRGALDAFFTHWKWLDQRRAKTGTHIEPYGVAPYYFYFAHYYAGLAIEFLPTKDDRREYRRLLHATLDGVQLEDGTWNDRVFKRSAAYGTALSVMALEMHRIAKPAPWGKAAADQTEPKAPTTGEKKKKKKKKRQSF